MSDNRLTIKQVGYTYVFQVAQLLRQDGVEKIREDIRQQLKEGCAILPAGVTLVSVEQHLETFVE